MKRLMLTIMAVATIFSGTAFAADAIRLGQVHLKDGTDRDVIDLPRCKGSENTPIVSLKFKVNKFHAQVDHLKVVFQNGDEQKLPVKKHFDEGQTSRWIDMDGAARCVDKIIIVGDTDTWKKRPKKQAMIAFWGR